MERILIIAMLLVGTAQAQTVIVKCLDTRGQVAYTTDACPSGQVTKSTRIFAAVHEDPASQARLQAIQRQQDRHNQGHADRGDRSGAPRRSEPSERDRRRLACAKARQEAEQARGKEFSTRKLQSLDKIEMDACFAL